LLSTLTLSLGLLTFLFFLYATVTSFLENERRAAVASLLFAVFLPVPYVLVATLSFTHKTEVSVTLAALTAAGILIILIPSGRGKSAQDDTPTGRIDERDTMFSRNALEVGSVHFEDYYRRNPEKKGPDDQFRARPGLLSKAAKHYDPISFSAADATFDTVEALYPMLTDHTRTGEKIGLNPEEAARFIKTWGRVLGAVSVGITKLADYHIYSIAGRGPRYGRPVDLNHRFAIALTVEMDKRMIDCAPLGPTVMESAQQYLTSGTIAVQIAEFIQRLGHPARAHIDANYSVVCPLVARDAGLGEIGRMGLLMTPEVGPRVRIAVVTTDLLLATDSRAMDRTVVDFCGDCSKCADMCPSRAIPFGDRAEIGGVRRWQINSLACFTYWCSVGTDCALCVRACPYSHPDSFLHKLVRRGVRNSSLFRKLAIRMDDVFYGHKPARHSPPQWMRVSRD
jgi:ferredoxin